MKHRGKLIAVVILVIIIAVLSYPFIRLLPLGYSWPQAISLTTGGMLEKAAVCGRSELFLRALADNKENIKRADYYLIPDAELPSGLGAEDYYQVSEALRAKGYTASELRELRPVMNAGNAAWLSELDHTEDPEALKKLLSEGDPGTLEALKEKGYALKDVIILYSRLSGDELQLALKMKYFPALAELSGSEGFQFARLARYLWAESAGGMAAADAVAYVNADGDYVPEEKLDWTAFYHDEAAVADPASLTALVNKQNYLPSDYVPSDLEYLPAGYYVNNHPMRTEARDALIRMSDAAVAAGYGKIRAQSNYRSYSLQKALYNNYKSQDGQAAADRYSARPGYSDHQTGLVSDLSGSGRDMLYFDSYGGYSWVLENAHLYGFIQRYPQGKEYITGYEFESWHFRYVGVEAAALIYKYGWTLEEYCYLFG